VNREIGGKGKGVEMRQDGRDVRVGEGREGKSRGEESVFACVYRSPRGVCSSSSGCAGPRSTSFSQL
jgi:hypothetical protein